MDDNKPYLVVLIIQLIYAGLYVISEAAFEEGLSTFVFIFYRQAAATILLVPLAFLLERKTAPPISFSILLKIFVHTLLGMTFSLNGYNFGLKYTSATVASACSNSIPVTTFFMALILRIETVKIKSLSGIAKLLGVAVCFAGVLTIAFYTGPHINPLNHHHLFNHKSSSLVSTTTHSKAAWIKGTFFMVISNTTWALWLIFQGLMLREYSSKLLLTTIQCMFSTIQTFFVALAFERDMKRWQLGQTVSLLAIAYCGFVVTGVAFYLNTWCIEKRGAVFLAVFNPLAFVFTMFCSALLLGEIIHLGSILGGILMVVGLYAVLWGKSRESVTNQPTIEDGKAFHEEREIASPYRPL